MDEDIEALWKDRDMNLLHGSVFDDLIEANSIACDVAHGEPEGPPHPEGRLSRAVVLEPSDRLLRTMANYGNVGTVLQFTAADRRLVLGPAMCVDELGFAAATFANQAYAEMMRNVFGDDDGRIELAVLAPDDATRGDRTWVEAD